MQLRAMSDTTLFFGGQILTVDESIPYAEAVLIKNGTIAHVGSLRDAEALANTATDRVDLRGSVLLPGFIDAHSHLLWAAKTRGAPVVDVRPHLAPTFDAVMAKIERRVAAAEPGEYLLFYGIDAQLHDGFRPLTRDELDEIAPQNPLGCANFEPPRRCF